MPLSLKDLHDSMADGGVGIRARTELEPLGGPGDKLAPPTYGVDSGFPTRYATEQRRVDGQNVPSVVLDSVASQANRLELALLEAVRNGDM
jgi:CRISPR-associated protein Csb1